MKLWRKFLEINAFNFGSHYQRGQARPSIRSKEFWHHYWGDAKAHWPVSVFWTLMIIIEPVFVFWLIWNPEVYGIKSQTVSWQGAVLGGWCLTAVVVWLPLSLREGLRRRDSGEYTPGPPIASGLRVLLLLALLVGCGVTLTMGYLTGPFTTAWYTGLMFAGLAWLVSFAGLEMHIRAARKAGVGRDAESN